MELQLSTEPFGWGRTPGEVAEIVLACPQTFGTVPKITGLHKLRATYDQHVSKSSKSDFTFASRAF